MYLENSLGKKENSGAYNFRPMCVGVSIFRLERETGANKQVILGIKNCCSRGKFFFVPKGGKH